MKGCVFLALLTQTVIIMGMDSPAQMEFASNVPIILIVHSQNLFARQESAKYAQKAQIVTQSEALSSVNQEPAQSAHQQRVVSAMILLYAMVGDAHRAQISSTVRNLVLAFTVIMNPARIARPLRIVPQWPNLSAIQKEFVFPVNRMKTVHI
jgi:hypothetical protein